MDEFLLLRYISRFVCFFFVYLTIFPIFPSRTARRVSKDRDASNEATRNEAGGGFRAARALRGSANDVQTDTKGESRKFAKRQVPPVPPFDASPSSKTVTSDSAQSSQAIEKHNPFPSQDFEKPQPRSKVLIVDIMLLDCSQLCSLPLMCARSSLLPRFPS